ncbi:MAG: hypothetical protein ACJ790_03380 [Myxococcaceae bacterium]
MPRFLLILAASVLCSSCLVKGHSQNDGTYSLQFADADVIKDTCGHLSGRPLVDPNHKDLYQGALTVIGETVRFHYALLDTQMSGYFLAADMDSPDRFTVDGSANNATVPINGAECLVDIANLHLEATTITQDEFTGVLSVRYETRLSASCSCEFLVNYRAVRQQ